VSSERRERFLKLERERPAGASSPDPLPEEGRFEQMGGDRPAPSVPAPRPGPPSIPSSSTDRFRPAAERPLEVAEERPGAQPFTRCFTCETDNSVHATHCSHCGVELDTPAQRAFNEKLWARRQAEAEAERREVADLQKAREEQAAEQARMKREVAIEMARRERDRLDDELPDGPFGQGPVARPGADTAGMRLLRRIPGTGWRIAAALVVFGIPLLLLLFGRGLPQLVGMLALAAVVTLFSPGRRRTRRW
jgi:hypothetical protein